MEVTTYTCDECGRTRGEANHWFRAEVDYEPSFCIIPWSEGPMGGKELHLCGMGCAVKAMTKAMETPREVPEEVSVGR